MAGALELGGGLDALALPPPFGTALVLNVLEQTFDPIAVLGNARRLLVQGGKLVAITPCASPIHRYPVDCSRLLPCWYRRYGETRGLSLDDETFCYVGFGPVTAFRSLSGEERLPPAGTGRELDRAYSRLVHALFGTLGGETQHAPRVAIGAVIRTSRTVPGTQ